MYFPTFHYADYRRRDILLTQIIVQFAKLTMSFARDSHVKKKFAKRYVCQKNRGLSINVEGNLIKFQNSGSTGLFTVAVAPGSGFWVQRFRGSRLRLEGSGAASKVAGSGTFNFDASV
jgi:hypothetical protein